MKIHLTTMVAAALLFSAACTSPESKKAPVNSGQQPDHIDTRKKRSEIKIIKNEYIITINPNNGILEPHPSRNISDFDSLQSFYYSHYKATFFPDANKAVKVIFLGATRYGFSIY